VFEALFNPAIHLDDDFLQLVRSWEPRSLETAPRPGPHHEYGAVSDPISTLVLRNLAELARTVHNPLGHISELKCSYQQSQEDILRVLPRVKAADMAASRIISSSDPGAQVLIHRTSVLHHTVLGLLLTVAGLLNGILCAIYPHNDDLTQETGHLVQHVDDLADHSRAYRPLGASYMPLALMTACAASRTSSQRQQMQRLLNDWQGDFQSSQWLGGVEWLRGMLRAVRESARMESLAQIT
jgi:hypothetical protein